MTLLRPTLSLRRLVVFSRGKVAYDQAFKLGVNIIRGTNSSGKSTILDFIFYALGGDFFNGNMKRVFVIMCLLKSQ
jgi:DNA repair exonuclease SbcCD ATPase subunit